MWGIEEHDKRLFNYSQKDLLLDMHPEKWGTYQLGLQVKRRIWSTERVHTFLGSGLSYEKATFTRPFNHIYFEQDFFYILRYTNKYEKFQVPLTATLLFDLHKGLSISGTATANQLVFRNINNTEFSSEAFPYNEFTFELDEVHLSLGLQYRFNQFIFGISNRIYNYQKVDKVIFNRLIRDPRTDEKWERYNPTRFDISISYVVN